MATNDFLVVAPGPAPNVATQAVYAADPIVTTGNASGVAKSSILNKAWRQSSTMAAVLAQLIVDNTGLNAVDDGTITTLLANLKTAITGRVANIQVFTASGTYTPTSGTKSILVFGIGGGAAGGGCPNPGASTGSSAGGGGSGAFGMARFIGPVSSAVTIGTGGAGVANGAGGNGGATSLAGVANFPGGIGATAAAAFAGTQGTGSLGAFASNPSGANVYASVGYQGVVGMTYSGYVLSGQGAPSPYGGGGSPVGSSVTGANPGVAATNYGAGGSGACCLGSTTSAAGGAGKSGILVIWEYA